MFLTSPSRWRNARRWPAWLAVALSPLLVSACALQYDESYARPYRTESPAEVAGTGEPQRRTPFGLRLDNGPAQERAARAERMAGDPRLKPTPREQREARAMAMAQAEILKTGGAISYRGDGSASNPNKVRFVASAGALTIDYRASGRLNAVDGQPHALTVVIYQLADRVALDQRTRSEEGLRRLLDGEEFDSSVLTVRRITLQPGSEGQLVLDRPENGRYVALVAGYHGLRTPTSLHISEYHVGKWMTSGSSYLSKDYWMFSPLPLNLSVALGEDAMLVRDTGLIYGDMRRVTNLMWRQTQHYAINDASMNSD